MKSLPSTTFLALVTLLLSLAGPQHAALPQRPAPDINSIKAHATADYGKLPLSFEANRGQADPAVKFLAHGPASSLLLTDSGAVFAFANHGPSPADHGAHLQRLAAKLIASGASAVPKAAPERKPSVLRMQLDGARTSGPITGEDALPGTANYFIGNDPAQWRSEIPTFAKVRYTGIYPGIDLVFYGNQQQLEYDFVVVPHADASRIRLHFDGARNIAVAANGDLDIGMDSRSIRFHKPTVYQRIGGEVHPVEGSFELSSAHTVGFRLGAYDHAEQLVIDPVLAYSTYVGGGWVEALAVDDAGEAVISGVGFGGIATTPGAFETKDPIAVEGDPVYVAKLNAEGTGLIFATYLQGKAAYDIDSWAYGVGVDREGNVYVAGQTDLSDFPTTKDAFMAKKPHAQVTGFVSKLNAEGTKLIYSTYLGGSKPAAPGKHASDALYGLAVDAAGHAYVTGVTWSSDFPTTPGAYQRKLKPGNTRISCTVSKLNLDGSGLDYATYLGGSWVDMCRAIAIDREGNATVGGFTESEDYPVTARAVPRKVTGMAGDGMVSKLNADGTKLLYSTYLGGSSALDEVVRIADDPAGNVYVLGSTASTDFPTTPGVYQRHVDTGSISAFVAKFTAEDTSLSYATYLGESWVYPTGIAADSSGDAYITGDGAKGRYPITQGAFLTAAYEEGSVAFLTELNRTGSALKYSTFLGGSQGGECGCAEAVAIGADGDVYLAGRTYSPDFPVTPDAYMTTMGNGSSFVPYVMKLNTEYMKALPATVITITASANPQRAGEPVTFTAQVRSNGARVPTGLVGFDLWGGSWQTVELDSTGTAKLTVPSTDLPEGYSEMIVMYLGDDTHAPSHASMIEGIE
jgi:hypothetical protein